MWLAFQLLYSGAPFETSVLVDSSPRVYTSKVCFRFLSRRDLQHMLRLFGNPSGPSRVSPTQGRGYSALECEGRETAWTFIKQTSQHSTDVSIPIAVAQDASSRLLQSFRLGILFALGVHMTGCTAAGLPIMICTSAVCFATWKSVRGDSTQPGALFPFALESTHTRFLGHRTPHHVYHSRKPKPIKQTTHNIFPSPKRWTV